jgi:hypothetical protein
VRHVLEDGVLESYDGMRVMQEATATSKSVPHLWRRSPQPRKNSVERTTVGHVMEHEAPKPSGGARVMP